MNKREFCKQVASDTGHAEHVVAGILAATAALVAAQLAQAGSARLPDVALLRTSANKARRSRNPKTGAQLVTPARTRILLKPLAGLKARVAHLSATMQR